MISIILDMQMAIAPSFIAELVILLAHLINQLNIYKLIAYLTIAASQEVIETIQNNSFYDP